MQQVRSYKIALIGDSNSGKDAYINKLRYGAAVKYTAPMGGDRIYDIRFDFGHWRIKFEVYDYGTDNRHYKDMDGAMIVFGTKSKGGTANVFSLQSKFDSVKSIGTPIVICGTGCTPTEHPSEMFDYWPVSVADNYNLRNPFIELAQRFDVNVNFESSTGVL